MNTRINHIMNRYLWACAVGALALCAGVLNARADYKSAVLTDHPAGYWRFSETSVTTPAPLMSTNWGSVGAANNGNYTGTYQRGVPGVLTNSTGTYFVGGAWVQVPNAAALNPDVPFSVEYWIKPNPVVGALTCPLSSTDFAPTPRLGWLFYTDDGYSGGYVNGGYYFRVYSSAGTKAIASPAGLLTANWTHVVGVVDGVNVILYVNGQQVGSTPWGGTFTPNVSQSIGIGARYDAGFPQDGTMNEVAIYATALSSNVVQAHYQAATTNAAGYATQILAANPVGYWRLNERPDPWPVAANAGTLGTNVNGGYQYWSTTTTDLDSPTYPGFETANTVFEPSGTNGVVAVPALNLNTNTVTMECLLKRNGDEPSYAGVIFHRGGGGTATGLDFHDTSNNLGYHWSDQANTYGWVSGLIPPDGVWTYAALAVGPSQAVIYMYDGATWSAATNVVDHPVQAFANTTLIGADNGPGRPYHGVLDEVAIYGQTLTEGQARTHALGAFGDPAHNPPTFLMDPPVVTPAGVVYSTTPFTLTADVYGQPPLAFQWLKNGAILPGATSFNYSRAAASTSDNGSYSLIVSNTYGMVTSQVAVITVNAAIPPTITNQPLSRVAYSGGAASFTVGASGTTPFSYQWQHATTNLPGATNATLFVSGVDATKTGAYTVAVTNVAGKATSTSATLSITTPPANSYEAAVVGLGPMAYWKLNEASGTVAFDYMGGYDVTQIGNVIVGQPGPVPPQFPGFPANNLSALYDGSTATSASTGVSLLNNRTNFTMCGWINPIVIAQGGFYGQNDVVEFRFLNGTTIELWTPRGSIDYTFGSSVTGNDWNFIAASGTATTLNLYINGQLVATAATTATAGYGTSTSPFILTGNTSGNGDPCLNGFMDEVALYPHTLSDAQIYSLYAAGAYGTTTRPFVTRNPAGQTVMVGGSVNLSASIAGSLPLTYQWKNNGVNIPGATSPTLTLNNVYFTNAGSYVLWGNNNAGQTNTAAATVTVMPPPTFAYLTNGVVLHLQFNGDYADSSGSGNDATAIGSVPFIAGKIGQAAHVATTPNNNYLVVNDTAGNMEFDETMSFTVSFWVRYTDRFNDNPIIGNARNSTYQLGWVFTDEGGKLEWSLVSTANSGTYLRDPVGPSVIGDGNWHNVVGVVDRQQQMAFAYVDGVLDGSWSIAGLGTLATTYSITIGQDPTGAYGSETFDLDDVGIWSRALSSYEAASVYGAGQSSGQSFNVYGPVKTYVNHVGNYVDVSWQAGTLLQSTNVSGTYNPVQGATVPFYRTSPTNSAMFFRVRQ
jgi:hypothetical protein